MVGYSSIPPSAEAANGTRSDSTYADGGIGRPTLPASGCNRNVCAAIICGILGLFGVTSFSRYLIVDAERADVTGGASSSTAMLPMPVGVNLGSWLSLEDYFYVGPSGASEVATPDDKTVGSCLPPLHVGPDTGPRWNSETDLYANLTSMKGGSIKRTIQIFHGFRMSYLDWDEELAQISKLGIERVRVSISWCLTDHDPNIDPLLGKDDDISLSEEEETELERRYTCLDPFFAKRGEQVRWPAVPRPFLASFLEACSRHNLKATLDIHTYPGGTSIGTFSGVWPRRCLFWEYDDPENVENDIGRGLLRDFFEWVTSLRDSNHLAFEGIAGITPMNEPGHLAGLFGPGSANPNIKSFLPSLPDKVANDFLAELGTGNGGINVPDGPHLRVLKWQSDAIETFRRTTLADDGIELYVNVHESVFTPSLAPKGLDDDEKLEYATGIFGAWWAKATTPEERASSIVLDMHRYHAWGPTCQGTVDGPPSGNYTCGDDISTSQTIFRCSMWAKMYREVMNEQLGEGARLMSAEFSASTHHSVLHSCTDTSTLRKTYLAQVEVANDHEVELFWWSWKMPHGGMFRPAWSFKHFLHRLGVEGFGPDESEVVCGSSPM